LEFAPFSIGPSAWASPEDDSWRKQGGWRIYEGGGGVKGKMVVLCFEWRSEQAPVPETGGMRAQPHFSLDADAPNTLSMLSERKLTHLSGLVDQDVDSQPGVS
jgi:hypothetical protein